jgi:hypothetical protein
MQYTNRKVPKRMDAALRRRAQDDLHDISGTWWNDLAFDRALFVQDTIDRETWQ